MVKIQFEYSLYMSAYTNHIRTIYEPYTNLGDGTAIIYDYQHVRDGE
jgi:hypothetical protein